MKKILSVFISIMLVLSAVPQFAFAENAEDAAVSLMSSAFDGGDGTEENPYLISTEAQLRLIQDFPTCSFELIDNIELTSDWSVVGSSGDNFSGTLNGNYCTVSGLGGRFFETNNGTVKNLTFKIRSSSSAYYAVVAYTNGADGIIENCKAIGNLKEYTSGNYGYSAAGFVNTNTGTIRKCSYEGTIEGSGFGFVYDNSGTIENCYTVNTLTGMIGVPYYGFLATNQTSGKIANCYSVCTLGSATLKYGFYRSNYGTITSCYYDKDTIGTDSTSCGTPKTTLAMKMQETYEGWDFDNTWDIDENINDGYPYLQTEQNFLPKVDSITFDKDSFYLQTGTSKAITTVVEPADTGRKMKWTSSDESVATTAADGTVTAVGAGTAEITLSMGDYSKSCTVNVVDNKIDVAGMSLDKEVLNLDKGTGYTLTAALDPANATDQGVKWASSDTSVATVSDAGEVKAVGDGTAVITAITNDGDYDDTCTVNARTPVTGIILDSSSLNMYTGKTHTLKAAVAPADATNQNIIWTSSNPEIASVADGIITAKSAGTVKITATTEDGGKFAECDVVVTVAVDGISLDKNSAVIRLGKTQELSATITPSNAGNQNIIWTTSNGNVAAVDNGIVTAVGTGTATITATTEDLQRTASCVVTVPVDVTGITLDHESLTVNRGRTSSLTATILPSNATYKNVTWTSSDSSIVAVENGALAAKALGTATITATTEDGGKTAQCFVTVKAAVENLTLSKSSTTIKVGQTDEITAIFTPSDATNQNITWSSTNESIVTVNNGKLTAVSPGIATVTAVSEDGNIEASCKVLVPVSVTGIDIDRKSLTINRGSTSALRASVVPSNATNQNISWSSSDESVATVENGVVTAVSAGTATITAITADEGKSIDCTVTVVVADEGITLNKSSLKMIAGNTEELTALITPSDATDKTVVWSSSNDDVATVDGGVVTAVGIGTAVIRAVSANGQSAECLVSVIVPVDGITLDKNDITINVGENKTITAKVSPENATDKNVTWTSSDENIASVENGVITANAAGEALIAATSNDGGKIASCKVTVVVPVTEFTLSKSILMMKEGDNETVTANIMPQNATDKNITWTSSDENVAAMTNGSITAKKVGTAVITAECGALSTSCIVNVSAKYSADIIVGNVRECAGENITVPIGIKNNPGIAAFNLNLKYDTEKLEPVGIEAGDILSSGSLTSNLQKDDFSGDTITAYWVSSDNVATDGDIINLTFKIKDDIGAGDIPITAECTLGEAINQNHETIALEITNGTISVVKVVPGDVMENGIVNSSDGLKLCQYLAEWDITLNKFEKLAADVYADGEINTKDGLKLNQMIAGWDMDASLSDVSLLSENCVKFKVTDTSAAAGEYVDVPVQITENSGVAAFKIKINYDKEKLTPVSISKNFVDGSLTSNLQQSNFDGDYVTAYWVNASNVTHIGDVFTIRFKISDNADGEIPISILFDSCDILDQNYNELTAEAENGQITIGKAEVNSYEYTVNSIYVDEYSNGHAYAKINVTKNIERDNEDTLIIAVYDDNNILADVTTMQSVYLKDQTVTFRARVLYEEGYTIKAFVWDNINNMRVLSNALSAK